MGSGSGSATATGAGGSGTGSSGSISVCTSGAVATGWIASSGRTTVVDGGGCGAWIGGWAMATALSGASSSTEYSRTRRPWPQSTSSRNVSSGWSIGAGLVTRTTGWPSASTATAKRRLETAPSGGSRPIRRNVSGDARRACSWASSPVLLEMIGISATRGSPGRESTSTWPRPRAMAGSAVSDMAIASKATTTIGIRLCTHDPPPRSRDSSRAQASSATNKLRELHCIQRCALADVVRHHPQVEAPRVRKVLADPAHEHRIPAGSMGHGCRVTARLADVHDLHARCILQQPPGLVGSELVARLDVDRLGVAIEHRHPHHRGVHPDAVAEDPARLGDQLHFLAGVAVGVELAPVRDHVEGDLHRIDVRARLLEAQQPGGLPAKFLQRATPGTGHGLVGRHVDALDARGAMQR